MHLFAGAGGGILADLIMGHRPIVAVEWDDYAAGVLRARSKDGWFDGLEVWHGDVREFNAHDYQGRVDCIHAGFPCQDISVAGGQAGVEQGTRSGLYREVLRIADEVRPRYLFLENVSNIVGGDDGRMLRTVVGDLAERGFDAVWTCLSAAQVGANHKRDRWWLLGYPSGKLGNVGQPNREHGESSASKLGSSDGSSNMAYPRRELRSEGNAAQLDAETQKRTTSAIHNQSSCSGQALAHTNGSHGQRNQCTHRSEPQSADYGEHGWWGTEPAVGRVANGVANRSHRLRALGNGQVPLQCAVAFTYLWELVHET